MFNGVSSRGLFNYIFHHKLTRLHRFLQKSYEFHAIVNMNKIQVCIQYLKYSNK
jgi:hypothetical protein